MGDKKKKHGPPDHFTGIKNDFLAGNSDAFQLAWDSKKITEFYDLITLRFIQNFGENMETIWNNLTDVKTFVAPNKVKLSPLRCCPKIRKFQENQKSIIWHSRKISYWLCSQKLAQWYQRKYSHIEGESTSNPISLADGMRNGPKPPQLLMMFHMYFKKYYHSCVKAKYQWQYQMELTEYNTPYEQMQRDVGRSEQMQRGGIFSVHFSVMFSQFFL